LKNYYWNLRETYFAMLQSQFHLELLAYCKKFPRNCRKEIFSSQWVGWRDDW